MTSGWILLLVVSRGCHLAWRPIQRPEAAAGGRRDGEAAGRWDEGDRWEGDGVLLGWGKVLCGAPSPNTGEAFSCPSPPRKGELLVANTAVAAATPDPPGSPRSQGICLRPSPTPGILGFASI